MSLLPGEIVACCVLPILALGCGLLWVWRRPGHVKRVVERLVGAKKQKSHHRGGRLRLRSASVEDGGETGDSSTATLTRGQPSPNGDMHGDQVHPSPPPSTYQPQSVERECIPSRPCLYLHIIIFTSSPQTISFPDLLAVQVQEVPGVVFSLYINPTLREGQGGLVKDIDLGKHPRASIQEFRIMGNRHGTREDADGVIDATPDCKGEALARPLQVVPEEFSIQSALKELAKKIMEQEGTCWQSDTQLNGNS